MGDKDMQQRRRTRWQFCENNITRLLGDCRNENFRMGLEKKTKYSSPSRDCLNFLHAAWKHAGYFFLQNMENSGSLHGNIL